MARLEREWRRLVFVRREVLALVRERRGLLRADDPTDPTLPIVRRLLTLRGVGEVSAWVYTTEFFAWRQFRNRRQVGAAAGLCSTVRASGDLTREQGISKAGSRYLRALAIELAWSWVRRQPQSDLSQWYRRRFAMGGARLRRIGIVSARLPQRDADFSRRAGAFAQRVSALEQGSWWLRVAPRP